MNRSEGGRERNTSEHKQQPLLWRAFQVGGLCGMSGLLFGGVAGILRSSTPTLFAIASSIQWFTLGGTYWTARGIILNTWERDLAETSNRIAASSIAGGLAGSAGGLLRGSRNVVPGALVFAVLGGIGQIVYNTADARHDTYLNPPSRTETMHRWLDSKWSPVKVLSDDEYEGMLQEKLLRVEAEIALINEDMARIQKQAMQKAPQTNSGE